ncbi:nucleotidyl transferase AbiEii/AbiGii toxin family protein [Hyphomonas sp. NPDC076900]|uniref:nucleotidyl transferase AbiEii/AbiGii toxin family protein n=1 Tax=unclassified Hyphomonas TaxID=2630699 RepID=UPI003D0152DA
MTTNIPASVRTRLFNRAKKESTEFQTLLVRFAIERILYRLCMHAARERFVLKGAMLFTAWPESTPRPTGDLDLLGQGSPDAEAMIALFSEIGAINLPADGILFPREEISAEQLREDEEYQGLRIKIVALLDGARIPFKIDIGFGDFVHPRPAEMTFPTLLEDMPPPIITAYRPATVVAEKFEAMIRFGLSNGRLKDYYDLREIARTFHFSRGELVHAINGTLERRQTVRPSEMPAGLTVSFSLLQEKQRLWTAFLRRHAPHQSSLSLDEVVTELAEFLGPVIQQLSTPETALGSWSPQQGWAS